MKLAILTLAAALAAILIVLPVGATKLAPSGTIVLDQSSPHLGDTVTFTWSMSKHERIVLLDVHCKQGATVVYAELKDANEAFTLGTANGLAADCEASLIGYSYGQGWTVYAYAAFQVEG